MQYRNGIIISTAAATNVQLGFVPDRFTILNYTKTAAQSGVGFSEWIKNVVASGKALISTYTVGAPVVSLLGSNGITPVSTGGVWGNTVAALSGVSNANPGVVTLTDAQAASVGLVNGMTITLSSVGGMPSLNTNRYIVAGLASGGGNTTFNLYDTFGNPVSTVGIGTYVASTGELDVISYPQTAATLNPVTGQVVTPGSPPGLQLDTGFAGVTLGTGVVGSSNDVLYYEAFLQTPTGY